MIRQSRTLAGLVATSLLLSCGGEEPLKLTTLEVTINPTSIAAGAVAAVTIVGKDQKGGTIAPGPVTFTATPTSIATVSTTGVITGVAAGQAVITATATTSSINGQAIVTVTPPPVSTVTVSPAIASVNVASTQQMTATTYDAQSNVLTGRTVTWSSSDVSKATINATTGLLTAVAVGTTTITATSEGKTGSATINVVTSGGAACQTISLALGEVHAMTAAEMASTCISGGTSGQEFVMIPFNRSTTATSNVAVSFSATGTTAIQNSPTPPPASFSSVPSFALTPLQKLLMKGEMAEIAFRARDRATMMSRPLPHRVPSGATRLTGIPATPTVGSSVSINSSVSGNDLCSSARVNATATVVAVTTHAIVLSDNASPANGYTSAQLAAFGQKFEDSVWTTITGNFGTPSDIDNNGRVAILFTPEVNKVPAGSGVVLGLFASRDLVPANSSCPASNVGEMFYMPVPDPDSTINSKYTDACSTQGLCTTVLATLAHEFQHLINAGRRLYVNNAPALEEVWLNEGLSHIAEEMMFQQAFPTTSKANIGSADITTQAKADAINNYELDNLARFYLYTLKPESTSPYTPNDSLETRGAIWLLLRYAVDRKSSEAGIWAAFDNATTTGQTNFTNILGSIPALMHDMTIATFLDDAGLSAAANYTHPSYNFRSLFTCLLRTSQTSCNGAWPLLTRSLTSSVDLSLAGGGAGYLRFRVAGGAIASISGTSAGNPIPAGVDVTLVRTH